LLKFQALLPVATLPVLCPPLHKAIPALFSPANVITKPFVQDGMIVQNLSAVASGNTACFMTTTA
jgi:hypothetical protein